MLGIVMVTAPAMAAEPALTWSEPRQADPGGVIFDIDCPTSGRCVAVDQGGNVVTTNSPSGAASDWTVTNVSSRALVGVSCMSPSDCIAISNGECAPGEVCPAVEEPGLLLSTVNPLGGAGAWTKNEIPGAGNLRKADCTSGLCAVLDVEGQIATSVNPAGGIATWGLADIPGSTLELRDISCPSASLCVAVGSEMHDLGGGFSVRENVAVTSTNPTGGTPAWSKEYLGLNTYLRSVSCPSEDFCLAVDEDGEAWSSANPTGTADAWSNRLIDTNGFLAAVACPTSNFCVVLDELGNALTSLDPSGGLEAWAIESLGSFSSVSCASSSLCLGAGFDSIVIGLPNSPPAGDGGSPGPSPPLVPGQRSSLWLQPGASLRIQSGDTVKLLLTCLGSSACRGTAKLAAVSGGRHTAIAAGRFRIQPNQRQAVPLRLNRAGRKMFEDRNQVRASLRLAGTAANGEPIGLGRRILLKDKGS